MLTTAESVFSRVFGTALTQQGFHPAAEKADVFARMTGADTVGIIALCPQPEKAPAVLCGIATLYCPALEQALAAPSPAWLRPLPFFYRAHYPDTWDRDTLDALSGALPGSAEPAALQDAARQTLQWTEQLILPLFDRTGDLQSAVGFLLQYGCTLTVGDAAPQFPYTEDLLCIRADYQGDFLEALPTRREFEQHRRSDAERGMDTAGADYPEFARAMKEDAARRRQTLDALRRDAAGREQLLAECERRRQINLKYLITAGILPAAVQGGSTT
ncbi:MAG: hypothetical protein II723_00275 [Oscillospiraceae bacterium]|nr:hypothetical protein [Oscillospiraceae bacterium]